MLSKRIFELSCIGPALSMLSLGVPLFHTGGSEAVAGMGLGVWLAAWYCWAMDEVAL